jgi:copper chaperone CopZ
MTQYNTSLKCEGCVNAVRKGLNEIAGENNWSVDLSQAIKTLEISEDISLSSLQGVFEKAGHSIS